MILTDEEKIELVYNHDATVCELTKAANSPRWRSVQGRTDKANKATSKLLESLLGRKPTPEEIKAATYG